MPGLLCLVHRGGGGWGWSVVRFAPLFRLRRAPGPPGFAAPPGVAPPLCHSGRAPPAYIPPRPSGRGAAAAPGAAHVATLQMPGPLTASKLAPGCPLPRLFASGRFKLSHPLGWSAGAVRPRGTRRPRQGHTGSCCAAPSLGGWFFSQLWQEPSTVVAGFSLLFGLHLVRQFSSWRTGPGQLTAADVRSICTN